MRRQIWLLALILLWTPPAWAASDSAPPPDYRPPQARDVCPALAEDYELCSADPWSGNCAGFVTAAGRLGEIYRSELQTHPGWGRDLQTSLWWGCGSAGFGELKSLLERIDSAQARSLLAEEPYRSLDGPRRSPAPPPETGAQELDCSAPSTQDERNACAAHNLARARLEHERAFAACREKVAPALRQELVDAEASWKKRLPLECSGAAQTRDECLARACEERTRSIVAMHPECAATGSE